MPLTLDYLVIQHAPILNSSSSTPGPSETPTGGQINGGKSNLNVAAIAGGVGAGVVVIALVALALFMRRKYGSSADQTDLKNTNIESHSASAIPRPYGGLPMTPHTEIHDSTAPRPYHYLPVPALMRSHGHTKMPSVLLGRSGHSTAAVLEVRRKGRPQYHYTTDSGASTANNNSIGALSLQMEAAPVAAPQTQGRSEMRGLAPSPRNAEVEHSSYVRHDDSGIRMPNGPGAVEIPPEYTSF